MASANDMEAANRTYSGFLALFKWSIPPIAAIVILVLLLIA